MVRFLCIVCMTADLNSLTGLLISGGREWIAAWKIFSAQNSSEFVCDALRGCADVSVSAGRSPEPAAGD